MEMAILQQLQKPQEFIHLDTLLQACNWFFGSSSKSNT